MNSQTSVPLTLLVLALGSHPLFILLFICSFIPHILVEYPTINGELKLAQTGWQAPNVPASSWPRDRWCHVGSWKLVVQAVFTPHKSTFATCQGFCSPPESWLTSAPLSRVSSSFLVFIHSASPHWALGKISSHLPSPPILAWRNSLHPSGSNSSRKLVKTSPFRALLFFRVSMAFDAFSYYITDRIAVYNFFSIINQSSPQCQGGYLINYLLFSALSRDLGI